MLPFSKRMISTCCHITCRVYGRIIIPHLHWHQVWPLEWEQQWHLHAKTVQLCLLFPLSQEWHVLGRCYFFRPGPWTITCRATATAANSRQPTDNAYHEREIKLLLKALRVWNCSLPEHDLMKVKQKKYVSFKNLDEWNHIPIYFSLGESLWYTEHLGFHLWLKSFKTVVSKHSDLIKPNFLHNFIKVKMVFPTHAC